MSIKRVFVMEGKQREKTSMYNNQGIIGQIMAYP